MQTVVAARVVRPIRKSNCEILHDSGDIVVVKHWSEVLRTCTVMDDDGVDCQTGIPIWWLIPEYEQKPD